MNCQTFESLINDLTREHLMDAGLRESAHAHATTCARCAARLADEHTLTAGLRSLAAETHQATAPQRVERALLSAFRAQRKAPPAASPFTIADAPAGENISTFTPRPTKRWLRRPWAVGTAAAAAAVLLIVGLAGTRWQQARQDAGRPAAQASALPSFGPAPIGIHPTQSSVGIGAFVAEMEPVNKEVNEPETVRHAPRQTLERPAVAPRYRPASLNRNEVAQNAAQASDDLSEIATDFIPLTHGNSLAPEDGGQVLRVELPRSALVSFGLPMNVERAGERVKADVLMGEDGVARAIRFVR